jgi:hypothetical protein
LIGWGGDALGQLEEDVNIGGRLFGWMQGGGVGWDGDRGRSRIDCERSFSIERGHDKVKVALMVEGLRGWGWAVI